MRMLIVGDYHDQPVGDTLTRLIHKEKPTHLVSLGDFDIINSIKEFIEIAEDCIRKGIEVIDVPGNHDHAIFYNQAIESGHFRKLRTNAEKLHQELRENTAAWEYMKSLLSPENAIKRIKIGAMNAVIMHGAYSGDTAESDYQIQGDWTDNLWFRLLRYSDFRLNFDQMSSLEEPLMIRGHDHLPVFARNCKGILSFDPGVSGTHNLDDHCSHVVAPGAFCDGYYAVMEKSQKGLNVRFKKF